MAVSWLKLVLKEKIGSFIAQFAHGVPKPRIYEFPSDGREQPLRKTSAQGPAQDAQSRTKHLFIEVFFNHGKNEKLI